MSGKAVPAPNPTNVPAAPAPTPQLRGASIRQRVWRLPTPVLFVASFVLAVLVLWTQGRLEGFGASLQRLHPAVIGGVLALYALGPIMQCFRWDALVRMVGGAGNPTTSAEVFLTSVIVNYAAPIGLAAPTRAVLSARDLGLSASRSGGVVIWEAVLDIAVLGLLSLAWLMTGDLDILQSFMPDRQMTIVAAASLAALVAIPLLAGLWRSQRLRQRVTAAVANFVRYPIHQPGLLLAAGGLTVAYWALQAVVLWILLANALVAVRGSLVIGMLGPPVLIGMLSPVPGGAGVREALMVTVAHVEGVSAGAVLFVAIAYRACLFITVPTLFAAVRFLRMDYVVRLGAGTMIRLRGFGRP